MSRFTVVCLLAILTGCGRSPAIDLIAVGRIWTGNPDQPWAEAVSVSGGVIQAVGDSTRILRSAGPDTQILRDDGGMIVPGFEDDHTHFFQGGFQLSWIDLRETRTPAEFIGRIAEYARNRPEGEWILGGDWDHEWWPGAPLPTREWIDSVTPSNPVMVSRYDGHMVFANSLAMSLAGVDGSTGDVEGGEITRGPSGQPTGVFRDKAMGIIQAAVPVPTPAQMDSALSRAMAHAVTRGVTTVSHVTATWDEVAAMRRAEERGALLLRISVYIDLPDWRNAAESLRVKGPGDHWLRIAGVKGMMDGSLGSTTAWFEDPYDDASHTTGLNVTPLDSMRAWIGAADSAGLQVVIHAIGDRANAVLLDIFDSVATAHGPRDRRFRIEHAQHLRRQDIPRFKALGVIPSMQPYHAIDDGRWAQKRIGPERIKTTYAFRSLLDAGARLIFGSDWTVAPIDPLQGIYGAVTRRTLDGLNPDGWVPEEKITVGEALRAYTVDNAYGMFLDDVTGSLRPGLRADFVILDQDLTAVPPETIKEANVVMTIVDGKVLFGRQ